LCRIFCNKYSKDGEQALILNQAFLLKLISRYGRCNISCYFIAKEIKNL